MYKNYNRYVRENQQLHALSVLDSIAIGYNELEHYKNSFEVGVVNVNKAAIYLTQALALEQDNSDKIILLNTSEELLKKALLVYQNWQNEYSDLSEIDLQNKVSEDYSHVGKHRKNIVARRIENINNALSEINRRYSVIYTNLGIIERHRMQQDNAIVYYKKAIDYWEDNFTAKSNLNVLMGEKPLKRTIIQKLFPPDKKDK